MAQTKTKSKTTRKRTSGGQSNGGRAKKSRTSSSARKTTASARKNTAKRKSTSAQTRRSGQSRSQDSGGLAQKAKRPALAAGGVLLGLAGGAAAVARNSKRRGPKLPTPNLKRLPRPKSVSLPKSNGSTAAWVGEKAKTLGDAGHRVADMTDQVAKVEKSFRK